MLARETKASFEAEDFLHFLTGTRTSAILSKRPSFAKQAVKSYLKLPGSEPALRSVKECKFFSIQGARVQGRREFDLLFKIARTHSIPTWIRCFDLS